MLRVTCVSRRLDSATEAFVKCFGDTACAMNPSLLLLHLGFVGLSWGFNLDEEYPVVLRGSPGSYFGFSVAFHHNSSGNW